MNARTSLSPLLLAAALAWGCTKEEPPPPEDRTLAKLRAEADRVGKGGAPSGPPARTAAPEEAPEATLANLATADDGSSDRKLRLPDQNDTQHVDTVAVKITGLESTHSVKGAKLSLTTEDLFLRVQLVAQNVGDKPAPLGLEAARLVDPTGKEYTVARDAQIAAGTRELRHTWAPQERADVVLFFEIPPPALDTGLTLVLPAASGDIRFALR